MANIKGFPIYFDWIERLKDIEADRAFVIICALSEYFQKREDPVEKFKGAERALVGIMFDQIQRAENLSAIRSKNGQLGAFAKISFSKDKQTLANASTTVANVSLYNNNNNNNNSIIEKEIHKEKETPKSQSDIIEERFNQFWKVYPKKVAKGYALNCFKKLKPSAELTQRMIDAVNVQKKSQEWTKDNGEFIPNPSTWLNQGRWEDELKAPTEAKQEPVIPKYSNYDAETALRNAIERSAPSIPLPNQNPETEAQAQFEAALRRSYGG